MRKSLALLCFAVSCSANCFADRLLIQPGFLNTLTEGWTLVGAKNTRSSGYCAYTYRDALSNHSLRFYFHATVDDAQKQLKRIGSKRSYSSSEILIGDAEAFVLRESSGKKVKVVFKRETIVGHFYLELPPKEGLAFASSVDLAMQTQDNLLDQFEVSDRVSAAGKIADTPDVADYSESALSSLLEIANLESFITYSRSSGLLKFSFPTARGKVSMTLQIWFYESAEAAHDEFASFRWFPKYPSETLDSAFYDEQYLIRVDDTATNLAFRKKEFVARVIGKVGWSDGARFVETVVEMFSSDRDEVKQLLRNKFDAAETVRQQAKAKATVDVLTVEERKDAKELLVDELREGQLSDKDAIRHLLLLGSLKDPSTASVFRDYLDPRHSFTVRQHAIKGLGRTGEQSFLPLLQKMLETPPSGDIHAEDEPKEAIERRTLASAIGALGGKAIIPFFQECLQRDDYKTVKEVIGTQINVLGRQR